MDKKLVKGFYARSLNEYGYLARSSKHKNQLHKKSTMTLRQSQPEEEQPQVTEMVRLTN